MIGDIITQMVSHQLGAIVRIVTQINIKTGHSKTATMVAIIEIDGINKITMVMIGTQHIRKSQFNNQQLFNRNNQTRQAYSNQPASSNGNDSYMGHSNYNSSCSLSDVSSFVTHDGVTFDSRRIQGFPNTCTVN